MSTAVGGAVAVRSRVRSSFLDSRFLDLISRTHVRVRRARAGARPAPRTYETDTDEQARSLLVRSRPSPRRQVAPDRAVSLARADLPTPSTSPPAKRPSVSSNAFATRWSPLHFRRRRSQGTSFETWEAALTIAASGATWDQPAIIVVDEFPYLVEREPDIEAVIQKVWDRSFQHLPVMLVLIGSDIATMEALSEHGRPLYDRPREMVVRPLTPADIASMLELEPPDAFDAYLAIGGFPELALAWGAGRPCGTRWARRSAIPRRRSSSAPNGRCERSSRRRRRREPSSPWSARASARSQRSSARQAAPREPRRRPAPARGAARRRAAPALFGTDRLPTREVVDRRPVPALLAAIRGAEHRAGRARARRGRTRARQARLGRVPRPGDRANRPRGDRAAAPDERFGDARHVGGIWTRDNRVEVDLVGGTARRLRRRSTSSGRSSGGRMPFDRTDAAALATTRAQPFPGRTRRRGSWASRAAASAAHRARRQAVACRSAGRVAVAPQVTTAHGSTRELTISPAAP